MQSMFRGARSVRLGVMSYVAGNIEKYITLAEREWGTTVKRPNRIEAFEAVGFGHDDRCVMAISLGQSSNFVTNQLNDDGSRGYRSLYDVQIYVWCLGGYEDDGENSYDGRIQALSIRDDIAAVVRAMLLDDPSLGNPEAFEMVEDTLSEQYSTGEATPNISGRYIAGSVHEFSMYVDESLVRDVEHYANSVDVDPDKLLQDSDEGIQP